MTECNDWCRVFDTKHGKVLYWYEFDSHDQEDVIHQIFKNDIATLDARLSGWDSEMTQERFDAYATQAKADEFAEESYDMFKE